MPFGVVWPDGPATYTPFLPLQCSAQISIPQALHTQLCCSCGAQSLLCISTHVLCSWLWDLILTELLYTLDAVFCFPPATPLVPSAFPHLLFICTHLSTSPFCCQETAGLHEEWAISFAGPLHQVCTTVWALKALLAAALTEMNIVYLCNAQQVT